MRSWNSREAPDTLGGVVSTTSRCSCCVDDETKGGEPQKSSCSTQPKDHRSERNEWTPACKYLQIVEVERDWLIWAAVVLITFHLEHAGGFGVLYSKSCYFEWLLPTVHQPASEKSSGAMYCGVPRRNGWPVLPGETSSTRKAWSKWPSFKTSSSLKRMFPGFKSQKMMPPWLLHFFKFKMNQRNSCKSKNLYFDLGLQYLQMSWMAHVAGKCFFSDWDAWVHMKQSSTDLAAKDTNLSKAWTWWPGSTIVFTCTQHRGHPAKICKYISSTRQYQSQYASFLLQRVAARSTAKHSCITGPFSSSQGACSSGSRPSCFNKRRRSPPAQYSKITHKWFRVS